MSSNETGLQHTPARTSLSRTSLIARARRDAADSQQNPAYQQATEDYRAGNYPAAAANFRIAAQQGHAESQYLLSTMLEEGQGIARDEAEAEHWERSAADQGHAYAQANVSFRYYNARNFAEAFAWCQRAAHNKLPWAQYNLGLMHRKGEGTPPSNTEAAFWYRQAAAQDFPEAQLKLAELYTFGLGVPRNHEQAAAWYRRAAEHGNAEAQFQLGHLYAIGQGVEQDYVQSRTWIRKAAQQGHAEASSELKRRQYRDP